MLTTGNHEDGRRNPLVLISPKENGKVPEYTVYARLSVIYTEYATLGLHWTGGGDTVRNSPYLYLHA